MRERIFVAGATGAIGRPLVKILVDQGFAVFGTTRSGAKTAMLEALGAKPVIVNAFDKTALSQAVTAIRPQIVMHQLTDLPAGLEPALMAEALPRNARLRREGTRNLVAAAREAGARRMIAQSIAFGYAPGRAPLLEGDPLDLEAAEPRRTTVRGVADLEDTVLGAADLDGTVLRYGMIYGPGTGIDEPGRGDTTVHVEAAANAAFLSILAPPGTYNVTELDIVVSSEKARRILGWDPHFRILGPR